MLYVCVIEFKDGEELKASSPVWNDIGLFMEKWLDRPWSKICIYQRELSS